MLAFLAVYVTALVALFVSSFWTVDPFTSQTVHHWTLDNFRELWRGATYHRVALRTVSIAAAVTVTDAIIAFPFAYFMARVAGPRTRAVLFVLVLLPLWASYLARVYSWRLILNRTACSTGRCTGSACRRPGSPTRTRRCGSSSPTSGCRS